MKSYRFFLDDAFWHPKLGLVMSYLFMSDHGTHLLPSGELLELRIRDRTHFPMGWVGEGEALSVLNYALELEEGSENGE